MGGQGFGLGKPFATMLTNKRLFGLVDISQVSEHVIDLGKGNVTILVRTHRFLFFGIVQLDMPDYKGGLDKLLAFRTFGISAFLNNCHAIQLNTCRLFILRIMFNINFNVFIRFIIRFFGFFRFFTRFKILVIILIITNIIRIFF